MDKDDLEEKKLAELQPIATGLGVASASKLKKQELIEEIRKHSNSGAKDGEKAKAASAIAVAAVPAPSGSGAAEAKDKDKEKGKGKDKPTLTQVKPPPPKPVDEALLKRRGVLDILADGYGCQRQKGYLP